MTTKLEMEKEIKRLNERLSRNSIETSRIRSERNKTSEQLKKIQRDADYRFEKMQEIRTALETVTAVKFPAVMLGFDNYSNPDQPAEDELLSLLRHLYRLTN